jgi:hypothetical protein
VNFTVAVSSDVTGTIYPGSGTETLTYTVTNPSAGQQNLSGTSSAVKSVGGDVT